MSSRPLSLVSAGHPGRPREINHSRGGSSGSKSNRNGNSNRKLQKNWKSNRGGNVAPFPSAGKNNFADGIVDEPIVRGKNKGGNLNHLLSFQAYESSNVTNQRTKNRRIIQPRAYKGKEDYLQSTAQFIVSKDSELEIDPFRVDPDIPVPWKFIEAVRIFGQEETECPICLHPPIAAKVGRCGHAHCSSCILKLISISDRPQCPICLCDVKQADLRSVICDIEKRPRQNTKLDFVKMKRNKNTVVPVPQIPTVSNWLNRYERVISVSSEEILENIIEREEVQLVCQTVESEESEIPFIDQAKELLKARREQLKPKKAQNDVKVAKEVPVSNFTTTTVSTSVTTPVTGPESPAPSQNLISPDQTPFKTGNPNLAELESEKIVSNEENKNEEEKEEEIEEDAYYFYQTVDCGNVYLSSLNAKCLITEFGSLKDAPPTISANMIEIEDFTMDQEVRRRFRYLGHLSLGEAFSLAYIDPEGLGLSPKTFEKHKIQIQQKKKKLKQKDREETKASKRVEEYYDREIYGKYKSADISLSSHEMFPDFNESFEGPSSPSEGSSVSQPISMPTPKSAAGCSGSWTKSVGSPLSSQSEWPSASPSNATSPRNSFWGEMKKSSKIVTKDADIDFDALSDDNLEELRAPDYRVEFAADLYSALSEATKTEVKKEKSEEDKKPKKAQKKKKGRVLFST